MFPRAASAMLCLLFLVPFLPTAPAQACPDQLWITGEIGNTGVRVNPSAVCVPSEPQVVDTRVLAPGTWYVHVHLRTSLDVNVTSIPLELQGLGFHSDAYALDVKTSTGSNVNGTAGYVYSTVRLGVPDWIYAHGTLVATATLPDSSTVSVTYRLLQ